MATGFVGMRVDAISTVRQLARIFVTLYYDEHVRSISVVFYQVHYAQPGVLSGVATGDCYPAI